MKILVTGSGLLASSIVERLQIEGHELCVFSRSNNPVIKCRQIRGDIFTFEEFAKALNWKPQVIVHTAWITKPGLYRDDVSNLSYAQFTCKLAKYVSHSDIEHLIVLGTCSEYGHQLGPCTAGVTRLSPNSFYAKQKVIAFESIREILSNSEMRLTWARIFYPYGPDQDQKRLIPYLIHSLKNREPVRLLDTSSIHDWITTRDIASAISWIIQKEVPLEIDVGTSIGFTNLEILRTLETLLESKNQAPDCDEHEFGLNEMFVVGQDSPLFVSGWLPNDSLVSGLEWVLNK